MVSRGEEGEMNRDKPKSVSFIKGFEIGGRADKRSEVVGWEARWMRGLTVRRISTDQPMRSTLYSLT